MVVSSCTCYLLHLLHLLFATDSSRSSSAISSAPFSNGRMQWRSWRTLPLPFSRTRRLVRLLGCASLGRDTDRRLRAQGTQPNYSFSRRLSVYFSRLPLYPHPANPPPTTTHPPPHTTHHHHTHIFTARALLSACCHCNHLLTGASYRYRTHPVQYVQYRRLRFGPQCVWMLAR